MKVCERHISLGMVSMLTWVSPVETFAKLINHPDPANAAIAILDPVEWDSKGDYKEVVDATRKACKGGDVRVYKVALGGTRVEYWVVGVDATEKAKERMVGVKALAVES